MAAHARLAVYMEETRRATFEALAGIRRQVASMEARITAIEERAAAEDHTYVAKW